MTVLRLDSVGKSYGGVQAVCDLDFEIARGEVHGLIGPNGSGKSTTLNLISGLTPVSAGRIFIAGEDVTALPPWRRAARGLARTFQNIRLFQHLTVLENVMVGRYCHTRAGLLGAIARLPRTRREEAETRDAAAAALAFVGLGDSAARLPGVLPYGHQRLVELARALVAEPQLLLLDEPAAGMNPREKDTLVDLLHRVRDEKHLTVLLVEHDMRIVSRACERLTVLNFGNRIAAGPAAEVYRDPAVIAAYLGRPVDVVA